MIKKKFRPIKRRAADGSGDIIGLEVQETYGGWPFWAPVQKNEHGTQTDLEFESINKAYEYLVRTYRDNFSFDSRLA